MNLKFRAQLQRAEALGPVNRWFCSLFHQRNIEDENLLMEYFVRSGGAADFAQRFNEAMGIVNRWYCSERHCRDVREPEMLWEYYMRARVISPSAMAC